ncbi:hypothetical protein POTOM_061753 [Populus tomentosa]|uniref:Uncharacterized protein n=1 Tax=Populus tomentosa TaxID=118781 RepID=A0A8X7XSM0_POPTO|nr:hypothetical protein POTOM_061753 [Populus tomentosa]
MLWILLSDILEIDSKDKVQLSVSADSDLGTIYSITMVKKQLLIAQTGSYHFLAGGKVILQQNEEVFMQQKLPKPIQLDDKGTRSDDLVTFDGGYEMTLLPGGMYTGCPSIVSKSVAESKPYHLKFT